jgi:predicted TIM-barrel fold metal-dependent hydrolase
MDGATLPSPLSSLAGRIVDIDSHEMLPLQVWEREIGPCMNDIAEVFASSGITAHEQHNHPSLPGYQVDDAAIDPQTIWSLKGSGSPGAVDIRRRLEVMDLMGVKRQLMFPTAGLHALTLMNVDADCGHFPAITGDRIAYGKACAAAYNAWGVRVARHSDRVRPVLPVYGDTVAELMARARELIDNGIRAVFLPASVPPGGASPADPALDPFWELMTSRDIAVCLHVNVDGKIFGSDVWSDVPAFKGYKFLGEFKSDPWSTASLHLTAQNFLVTTVLGGVFERHPRLRLGVIELGAVWVGPLCDLLDMWYSTSAGMREYPDAYRLPQKPSSYIKRNVRVSPYFFEEIDRYIRNYDIGDVLCYASDYPHIEGGFDPMGGFYQRIAPLGAEQVEKFFVTNGAWLLPD